MDVLMTDVWHELHETESGLSGDESHEDEVLEPKAAGVKWKWAEHKEWERLKTFFKSERTAENYLNMENNLMRGVPLYNDAKIVVQQERQHREPPVQLRTSTVCYGNGGQIWIYNPLLLKKSKESNSNTIFLIVIPLLIVIKCITVQGGLYEEG